MRGREAGKEEGIQVRGKEQCAQEIDYQTRCTKTISIKNHP